jgi:hypothetical protein
MQPDPPTPSDLYRWVVTAAEVALAAWLVMLALGDLHLMGVPVPALGYWTVLALIGAVLLVLLLLARAATWHYRRLS